MSARFVIFVSAEQLVAAAAAVSVAVIDSARCTR